MSKHIPKPLDCLTVREAKARVYLDPWQDKVGSTLSSGLLGPDSELFEIRPLDFKAYAALDSSRKIVQCWVRLAPRLNHIDIKEPMFVPMAMCDYMSCHPSIVVLDQLRLPFKSGASLTHKVCIHRSEGFDVSEELGFDFKLSLSSSQKDFS